MTRLDYCQFLLVSQINYTLTHFADHPDTFSHDAINRYLQRERMTPRLMWDNVRDEIVPTPTGYLLFDYRLYDPDGDGKSKLDHVHDMLANVVHHKRLAFHAVLMDTWYATKDLMLFIESLQKVYYCPLKDNRQVDDSGGERPYQRVDSLIWSPTERAHGKTIKIRGFPKHHKVQLFRVEVSTHRTDWVVTNDATQHSTTAAQQACCYRWKIELLHREGKQLTGLPGFSVIISPAPSWFGCDLSISPNRRSAPFIN
jgi:hypothetical protein